MMCIIHTVLFLEGNNFLSYTVIYSPQVNSASSFLASYHQTQILQHKNVSVTFRKSELFRIFRCIYFFLSLVSIYLLAPSFIHRRWRINWGHFDRSEGSKVARDLFTEHAHPPRNVKGGGVKGANKELRRVGWKYRALNVRRETQEKGKEKWLERSCAR